MLEKNLEALKGLVTDDYLEKIKNATLEGWAEVIHAENGEENLLITEGSRKTTAYEVDDPWSRSKAQARDLPTKEQDFSILIGMGLGYLLSELLKKKDKSHKILVIEPSLWMLYQAFERFDFAEALRDKTLFLASALEDVSYLLTSIDATFILESYTLSIEEYAINKPKIYNPYVEQTAAIANQMRCNTGTVMTAGAIIADNDIANLPYVIQHRGVNELTGLFKGKPAVMVCTGPSLKKNIHLLRDYQDKVVIVAVAQALRVLLAYDIRPDFLTTVDFGEVNMVHLRGLMDSDVPLICLNKTYAPLLHSYQGPRFIVASPNPGYDDKAHGILGNKGALDSGGSVAHMNFSACMLMGCDPIIIIGQDLALTGGESHFAQADAGGNVEVDKESGIINWKVRDQRCHLKDVGGGTHGMGFKYQVEGYFGPAVLTNVGLASFWTVFERMFQAIKDRAIINSTQGGARIRGAHQMSLRRALAKYATKRIDKSTVVPLLTLADDADELVDRVVPMLKEDIKVLRDIIFHTRQGLHTNKKLLVLKRWENVKKTMSQNERHSVTAHELAKQMPLVALAIFGASRRIDYSDLKVEGGIDHLEENREHFEIRVKRNRLILEAARDASISLRKTYQKTLTKLETYQRNRNPNVLRPRMPDEKPDLSDAEEYFAQGNWARPLLIGKRILESKPPITDMDILHHVGSVMRHALKMRNEAIEEAEKIDEGLLIECNELVYDAQRIGREKKDYEKSLSMLKRARKICPENENALWGLATTFHHTDLIEASIGVYKTLIEKYPEPPRYRFEYGQVLIKAGQVEDGLRAMSSAMEQTEEFNSFMWVVGDICRKVKLLDKALLSYTNYLENFPADYKVMIKKAEVLEEVGREDEAVALFEKAYTIRGR